MDWQIGSQMPQPAVLQLIFDSENLSYHWEKDENYEEMGKHELKWNNHILLDLQTKLHYHNISN